MVILGALFIAACAQISFFFPFDKEVPVTFQTFAVLLIGSLYGVFLGLATVMLYLAEGAAGAPFFSVQTGGYKVLAGTTSGYLFGFLLAAAVTVNIVPYSKSNPERVFWQKRIQ